MSEEIINIPDTEEEKEELKDKISEQLGVDKEDIDKFTAKFDLLHKKILSLIDEYAALAAEYSDKKHSTFLYLITYTAAKLIEASNFDFDNSISVEYDLERSSFKIGEIDKVMFNRTDVDVIIDNTIKELFGEDILNTIKGNPPTEGEEKTTEDDAPISDEDKEE